MYCRSGRIFGFVLVGGLWLFDCQPAQATAIAFSDITAVNLSLTPAAGTVNFDPFSVSAFAQALNSLGELDAQSDGSPSNPALVNAMVTWADGHASASGVQWLASSNVSIPGATEGAASSEGQGLWFTTFTVTGGTGSVQVDFSADVSGQLNVLTDANGVSARTETIFNLNVDGDPVLFQDRILDIGPNDAQTQLFADGLSGSMSLDYDTPYFLLLRVDSESFAVNAPEPSTITLLGLGLGAAVAARRIRTARRPSRDTPPT